LTTNTETQTDLWAIVEVMGHSHYAGRVSEYTGLGVPLVRVEIPATAKQPACEKLLGAASIFRITPCTEEVARASADYFEVRPLELIHLPSIEPARLASAVDPIFDDDEDFDNGEDESE
jgi:hypothetical protein